MIKIGITGGIGCGKTTICKIFEAKGILIYYADDRAKKLMTSNKELKNQIVELFGKEAYFKNGRLNRKFLSSKIFIDKLLIQKLNSLVHPAVKADSESWFSNQKNHYAIKEAALLIESNSYKELDKIIVVTCPIDLRLERVMNRDHISKDQVLSRMKNQLKEEEIIKYANFIIVNDGTIDLIKQVDVIHNELIKIQD
jgi:dephospho-CoA kinase